MRVLCSTTAGEGHFGPVRALAQACRDRGHEVRVAAPQSFASTVTRAGLTHEPFPDASPEAIGAVFERLAGASLDEANRTVMAEVFGRLDARAALPGLQATIESWRPDVVLREPAEVGSLAAAESAGVPHAEVAIGVAAMMRWARGQLAEPLAELGATVGLDGGRLLDAGSESPVFTSVPERMDRAAGGTSSDEEAGRPVVRYRVGDTPREGRLPTSWGDPESPLVYVTFGTVAGGMAHLREVFGASLGALAEVPVRVLMTTGRGADVSGTSVPPNAHIEPYWPQDEVMPLAAAVVGHGGFGTTMTALAAGVPQVVVPLFSTDQFFNAEAVAAVGAGLGLSGGPGAVPDLAAALSRVVSEPGFGVAAADVAAWISDLPTASGVVDEVERIGGRGAPSH